MKTLIIAEKPSVAREIATAIGGFTKNGDCLESPTLVVSSAVGHLVELDVPEANVKGVALPIIPVQFGLKAIERTKSQIDILRKLIARPDVSTIVNACDAGREGELIFRLIVDFIGKKKPMQRMWIQSMTQDAIRDAWTNRKPGRDFDALAAAARCRAESDWLMGINASRAVSRAKGLPLSAGRVQTPTLAMLVHRHLEIVNFKPTDFFQVEGTFTVSAGTYLGLWQNPTPEADSPADRTPHRSVADAIVRKCAGQAPSSVTEDTKPSLRQAPQLFDLTSLQREANKRLGFSAKETLDLAQSLYERHKVLTYPRTDANCLPEDYVDTAKSVMSSLSKESEHAQTVIDSGWIKPNKQIFNNAKISDHFAIIPTGAVPGNLSGQESDLYGLVVNRFMAAFFPAAQYQDTVRKTVVSDELFISKGRVLVAPGWLSVYGNVDLDDDEEKRPALRPYKSGEQVTTQSIALRQGKTKAPKAFTEATLLSAMESCGKEIDDQELASLLKEKGLGTPATRASIIETLLNDKDSKGNPKEPYVRREKKNLVPTQLGCDLIAHLQTKNVEGLTSPAMTGEWEQKLRQIEAGTASAPDFMAEMARQTREVVSKLALPMGDRPQSSGQVFKCRCPKCGAPTLTSTNRTIDCKCGLKLWKTIAGKELTEQQILTLLGTGALPTTNGFHSKRTGKNFNAGLRLNLQSDPINVEFVFN